MVWMSSRFDSERVHDVVLMFPGGVLVGSIASVEDAVLTHVAAEIPMALVVMVEGMWHHCLRYSCCGKLVVYVVDVENETDVDAMVREEAPEDLCWY